jgi:hypothetical protein
MKDELVKPLYLKEKPMQCPNESDTEEMILKPAADRLHNQDHVNQKTALRYEALSYFEREEITKWLKYNLAKIPMLGKTKRAGMAELLAGNYCYPSALVLIRHTLKVLGL